MHIALPQESDLHVRFNASAFILLLIISTATGSGVSGAQGNRSAQPAQYTTELNVEARERIDELSAENRRLADTIEKQNVQVDILKIKDEVQQSSNSRLEIR